MAPVAMLDRSLSQKAAFSRSEAADGDGLQADVVKGSVAFAEKLIVEVRDWVTLIVAVIALVGVACSTAQKRLADNRDQWWKRTQWALERILLEDQASKVVGYGVLDVLIQSRRVGTEEFNMLLAVTEVDLEMIDSEAVDSADAGEGTG